MTKPVPREPTTKMVLACDDMAEDKYVARGRAIDCWTRMWDAAPAAQAEPVAWRYVDGQTEVIVADKFRWRRFGNEWSESPLYTAPAVPSDDARDAARYRWLRDVARREDGPIWCVTWRHGWPEDPRGATDELFADALDAAIDAAMRGDK